MIRMLRSAVLILSLAAHSACASTPGHQVIASQDIQWGLLNPLRGDKSPKAADLWGDRTQNTATGMLVKFNKGFSSPPHIHNISYRGVVIKGMLHNDDPSAQKMWLPPGSFWTQPAGESHVTAADADAEKNLIYLEIDSGPYLVMPEAEAFDNGEKPINVDTSNIVWLKASDVNWIAQKNVHTANLWGSPGKSHGTFIKLPKGFNGKITTQDELKAVVISGKASHQWANKPTITALSPSSFFSSNQQATHTLKAETEVVIYINSSGRYNIQ